MSESPQMRRYKKCREEGLCYRCGSPHETSKVLCPSCHEKNLRTPRDPNKESEKRKRAYRKVRNQALEGYGGKCQCCGDSRLYVLQIDHVNGLGGKTRKEAKFNHHRILTEIIKQNFPPTLQVLCANCHQAKTLLGVCPKEHPNPNHPKN